MKWKELPREWGNPNYKTLVLDLPIGRSYIQQMEVIGQGALAIPSDGMPKTWTWQVTIMGQSLGNFTDQESAKVEATRKLAQLLGESLNILLKSML